LDIQLSDELNYGSRHDISAYFDDVERANRKKTKNCGELHFLAGRIVRFHPTQEHRQKARLMSHSVAIVSIIRLYYIVQYLYVKFDSTWHSVASSVWA
jgi:hypothetical protein